MNYLYILNFLSTLKFKINNFIFLNLIINFKNRCYVRNCLFIIISNFKLCIDKHLYINFNSII